MRKDLLILIGLLAAVGLIAVSLRYVEWVEKEVDAGFSDEALKDRFLAASRFLDQFGVAAEQADSVALLDELEQLVQRRDAIIMTNTRRTLSGNRVKAVLDWVTAGGRLVLVAVDANSDDDPGAAPILEQVGIRMSYASYDDEVEETVVEDPMQELSRQLGIEPKDEDDAEAPPTIEEALESALYVTPDTCLDLDAVTSVTTARNTTIGAEFWHGKLLRFADQATLSAANRNGLQLVAVPWGAGSIVAMTSVELWENRHIHCHDNAHLLRAVVEGRNKVWWIFDTEMEPLLTIIWQRWAWVLLIVGLWLLAWSWRGALRLRAPVRQEHTERRDVMEHIDGIARFHYQQENQNHLLEHLRKQSHLNANDSAAMEALAKQIGESAERVHWALSAKISQNTNDFSAAVKILQRLKLAGSQPATKGQQ